MDGGIYHVYFRGNNRKWLFRGDEDFQRYKDLIKEQRERYKLDLYHYCLMTNHVHMLMSRDWNISKSAVIRP